jgi:hypothetical protein
MPVPPKPLPPLSVLMATFRYDKRTGRLLAKYSRTSRKAGEFADTSTYTGYRTVYVGGKNHLAHRVIWKMVHGKDPSKFIDHVKSGDTLNNRISNLREASHLENMYNQNTTKRNTSGVKGVHRRKDDGKFRAYISANRKRIWLGTFDTIKEAREAVKKARPRAHGAYTHD